MALKQQRFHLTAALPRRLLTFYLILMTTLYDIYQYTHFIDGETKVSERETAWLKATQLTRRRAGLEPRPQSTRSFPTHNTDRAPDLIMRP